MNKTLNKGDYVLATNYRDGDPQDQWCVGFYEGQENDRYIVIDDDGKRFRYSGFRRVKKISKERGLFILSHKDDIQNSPRSLWWWARCSMKNIEDAPEQNVDWKSLCNKLYTALEGLLDGLDANRDGYHGQEGVGISEKEWQKRIYVANKAVENYDKIGD
ncbi:MAG: hypothetical protein PHU71_04725 [Candidatus Gracilibacteria bacterium]|nr:hypothetical protein [Candidatus Gracilibacteria bacterium]